MGPMSWTKLAMTFGPYVAIAILLGLSVLFFNNWQTAREDVGAWKNKHATQVTYAAGLKVQLAEANAKINKTAEAGSVSYGHCQDLVANDAAKNFDNGVTFGKATCPVPVK